MAKVRVRFAPSPTGHLHIGNARTALFNYLFAKNMEGTFVLRIEDTDRERSKTEFENEIMEDLKWLGLDWDEGPDKPGMFAPYRQSERQEIYDHMLSELLAENKAYKCYCTDEELEIMRLEQISRGEPPRYNGKCRDLSPLIAQSYDIQGRPHTIRFKVEGGIVEVNDLVKDDVVFDSDKIGDFVVRRSDGTAAFFFANIIDDALMRITHVIRGDDHLSNTPRQILISEALGFIPPEFAHLPLIFGPDRTPLSKRHGDVSLKSFREKGYLSEAVVNYLAHLGISYGEGKDILSMDEMRKGFSLERVARSPAVFDVDRLNWINSRYMKTYETKALRHLVMPHLQKNDIVLISNENDWTDGIINALKDEVSSLPDLADHMSIFVREVSPDKDALDVLRQSKSMEVLQLFLEEFESAKSSPIDLSYNAIAELVKGKAGVKGKELFMPLRAALTGRIKGAEMVKILRLLGNDEIIKRLNAAIKRREC